MVQEAEDERIVLSIDGHKMSVFAYYDNGKKDDAKKEYVALVSDDEEDGNAETQIVIFRADADSEDEEKIVLGELAEDEFAEAYSSLDRYMSEIAEDAMNAERTRMFEEKKEQERIARAKQSQDKSQEKKLEIHTDFRIEH